MVRPRGFLLILCLLLIAILLVFALAIASTSSLQYEAAERTVAGQAAYQIAMAGLEEARVKLNKDIFFPPIDEENQTRFSFTESVKNLDKTAALGSFEVTVDVSYLAAPYYLVKVTSIGTVGNDSTVPRSRRAVSAELDVCPDLVNGSRQDDDDPATYSNPDFWTFVNFKDLGSY